MQVTFEHRGRQYRCNTTEGKSLAIQLDFDGAQPNHFGTDKASSSVLKLGGFTGDTKSGGSCNVDTLRMIPHCNGTHTETVGHIVNEDIWVGHAAMDAMMVALLITVTPESAEKVAESYRPKLEKTDRVITAKTIERAMQAVGDVKKLMPGALIVRTLPNEIEKCSRMYGEDQQPPFFTVDAMEAINQLEIRHLLVDFPSVDRMYDDGLLTNHHLYWNVEEKSHQLSGESWQDKTITEMIFVEDEIGDGIYALNLQVPAFCSDAAPSRPVVFRLDSN
jgi:arylformamidase